MRAAAAAATFLWVVLCADIDAARSVVVRYRARVAYDGHGFSGFQLQCRTRPNCRTVQGDLESALNRRFLGLVADEGNDDSDGAAAAKRVIKVVAASRTDTGVHARGQAVHFDVKYRDDRGGGGARAVLDYQGRDADLHRVCASLNQMLKPDVRLWNLQRVPPGLVTKLVAPRARERWDGNDDDDGDDESIGLDKAAYKDFQWNVLFDSTQKLYSYRLCLAPVMDPVQRYTRVHPVHAECIDVDALRRVLQHFVGTHDFRAFAGAVERAEKKCAGTAPLSTIRTVYAIDVVEENAADTDASGVAGNCRIDFLLQGALYKQVRNMVGTALDVCRGRISEEELLRLLRQRDGAPQLTRASNRSRPAPPEGLTLEMVYFDDCPDF